MKLFLLFFLIPAYLQSFVLDLKGYLDKPLIEKAIQTIDSHEEDKEGSIFIESTGGDIHSVLALAKRLGIWKKNGKEITVFINQNAVGPAAIFPFLADALYSSYYVVWGDIPYGNEDVIPTNLLKSEVLGLINPQRKNSSLLTDLAIAMCDPATTFAESNGKFTLSNNPNPSKQTLIVNQNQLQLLNIVDGIATPEEFRKKVSLPESSTILANSSIDEKLRQYIHYNPDQNRVGLIKIDDKTNGINQGTWFYVFKALEQYKKSKPSFIILELNTPGGEVVAAQKISDALKEMDTQFGIPIVCFINNWAISAGAMLAFSCRFITIVKDAAMGAAEPVFAGASGQMEEASEKVNSAMRADMANRAQFFGRNPYIAEAMVDKDVTLVNRHGEIIALNNPDQVIKNGPDPDVVISPKGKLLTLNAQELIQYHVADILLQPAKLEPITPAEEQKGEWPLTKMLLGTYPFFKAIPNATVQAYSMDFKAKFFSLLLSPVVSSILLLGLMMGIYFELSHPGFGLPGSVAVICLLLIVLSSFAFEVGNILELLLVVAGIAIIVIDLFFLPTFGLLGIFGVIAFLVGLFGLMIPGIENFHYNFDTGKLSAAGTEILTRLGELFGTFLLGLLIIGVISRYAMPKLKPFRKLVLNTDQEGYQAGTAESYFPKVGTEGLAISPLRPAGMVELEGKVFDAQSEGQFIPKGATVTLIRVEGSRLFVRPKEM